MAIRVGVLALQGAFAEHLQALRACGATPVEVRLPKDLEGLDALILPGGESTTIGKLLLRYHLLEPIRSLGQSGLPIWGTCAGMILLAQEVVGGLPDQPVLGLMNLRVHRNAFGRQVDSFQAELSCPWLGETPFPAVFIRAPVAESLGPPLEVLAQYQDKIVAARQGNLLATSFHPELSGDWRMHQWFLDHVVPIPAG